MIVAAALVVAPFAAPGLAQKPWRLEPPGAGAWLPARLAAKMHAYPHLGLPLALLGSHRLGGQRRDGTNLALSPAVSEAHVGGYLLHTAIVRDIGASERPPTDLATRLGAGGKQASGLTGALGGRPETLRSGR